MLRSLRRLPTPLSILVPALLAAAADAQTCTSPSPGLVSWWPMDHESRDIVDANQPAAAAGLFFEPGHVDGGVRLLPAGYIDVAHSVNLTLQRFSIEAWVRPDGPGPTNDSLGCATYDNC